MRIIKIAIAVALSFVILFVAPVGCASPKGQSLALWGYFGTNSEVVFFPTDETSSFDEMTNKIKEEMDALDKSVSLAYNDSYVSLFNSAAPGSVIEIDKHTYNILSSAKKVYELTGGLFNPAAAYFIEMWGFSSFETKLLPEAYTRTGSDPPRQETINAFNDADLLDFSKIVLSEDNGRMTVTKPGASVEIDGKAYSMALNFGGIAKGYAADLASQIVSDYGLKDYYVSVGTSSLRLGQSPENDNKDNSWKVGLKHPRSSDPFLDVWAKNVGASTSGDYENYFTSSGKRYCHIIDPRTGTPKDNDCATVSLFGINATEGDALTTALMITGENGLQMLKSNYPQAKYIITTVSGSSINVKTNFAKSDLDVLDKTVSVIYE